MMNGLEIYQKVYTAEQCNQLIKLFGDDDRKQSGIFIICADTDEEYDNYLKELRNPIDLDYTGIEETTPFGLQPGDIVINCLGKKIVLIQNDDLDIVYSFDFLNFITNS